MLAGEIVRQIGRREPKPRIDQLHGI
jgi:hypothetical protein